MPRRAVIAQLNRAMSPRCTVTQPAFTSAVPPEAAQKLHHPNATTKKFTNPWPSFGGTKPPYEFFLANLRGEIRPKAIPESILKDVEWQKPDFLLLDKTENAGKLKICWLGHASWFLELPTPPGASRGFRFLFDPILSERCSPTQYFGGPKRYTPPPVSSVEGFPDIDAVCISHNHYDHLDYATVSALEARFGKSDLHWFVSLGNKAWFKKHILKDDARISEMDWWEDVDFSKVLPGTDKPQLCKVGYLPAQHFSGRSLSDQGQTLWGSYSIESMTGTSKKVWFGGDTARRTVEQERSDGLAHLPVCPAHKQIGILRGPFDFAMIPIGAYKPRRLMSPVHVDPNEAADIFEEVRAVRAAGMHWGTFGLSAEDCLEPRSVLEQVCKAKQLSGFECWPIGELRFV